MAFDAECCDCLPLAVIQDLKIFFAEVFNCVSLAIPHSHSCQNKLHIYPECGASHDVISGESGSELAEELVAQG